MFSYYCMLTAFCRRDDVKPGGNHYTWCFGVHMRPNMKVGRNKKGLQGKMDKHSAMKHNEPF